MTRLSARPLTSDEKELLIAPHKTPVPSFTAEELDTFSRLFQGQMACAVPEDEQMTWFDRLIDWLAGIPEHYVWRACFGISMLVVLALLATVVWAGVL